MPRFHWWRTVFFLIPCIAVYTIVLGSLKESVQLPLSVEEDKDVQAAS